MQILHRITELEYATYVGVQMYKVGNTEGEVEGQSIEKVGVHVIKTVNEQVMKDARRQVDLIWGKKGKIRKSHVTVGDLVVRKQKESVFSKCRVRGRSKESKGRVRTCFWPSASNGSTKYGVCELQKDGNAQRCNVKRRKQIFLGAELSMEDGLHSTELDPGICGQGDGWGE